MNTWRILSVCFLLAFIGAAQAAKVGRNSGLGLSRTGPSTATGTVTSTGGEFGRLLEGPARLPNGGTEFGRLMEMPAKLPNIPADKGTVKQPLSPANIAKALRGGVGPYIAGQALGYLMEQACVRLSGGTMQMTESGAWEECVPGSGEGGSTPSTGYMLVSRGSGLKFYTAEDACASYLARLRAASTQIFRLESCTAPSGSTDGRARVALLFPDGTVHSYPTDTFYRETSQCPVGKHIWSDGSCHDDPQTSDVTWRPVSTDAVQGKLEDAIKTPANASRAWDAMRDYAEQGGEFDTDLPVSVEGPAQSPASTTTTTTTQQTANGPQTLTTTHTTVINYNYAGDTITFNQTTTSVTRNQAGEVVSTSTNTTNPDPPEEAPTDTPLPPVPELYVRKYPNGMEGIYDEYKDQLKNTSLVQLASQLMPQVGDGGTCPSWPLDLNLASWAAYGVHDVAPPCWIWGVAKAILILSALLLARALIFGG